MALMRSGGGWCVAVLGLALACGGGGSKSASTPQPPPPPPAAPALTSFSPATAVVGAPVTLTGTALTGATAVSFNGQAATYTLQSDTSIQATVPGGATSGAISVTTAGGTATSSNPFTVAPTPAPTVSGFSPIAGSVGTSVTVTGSGFWGATAVAFGGTSATFTIQSDTQLQATVPAGAGTATIQVTNAASSAASAAPFTVTASASLDLTIEGLYVTQGTQTYPTATVNLVKDRSAWVRVFVKANEANAATPQVRVRFINGGTTNALTIPAPGASTPLAVNEAQAAQSWNMAVPAAWIQPGLTVVADVDPGALIPESNEANNQFPAADPQPLAVENLAAWKIRLLPVTTGDGRVGAVDAANQAAFVDMAKRVHPVSDAVDVAVGPALTSSLTTLANSQASWSTILDEVTAKWNADGRPATYYGVVNPAYGGGIAGLGWVGQAAAIGWDKSGSRAGVLAHEVGHTFGRSHSPCGGAGNPDPNYPTIGDYAGGHIGVTGWDVFAPGGSLKAASTYTDIMGYCSTQWVSDYVFKKVLGFRKGSSPGLAPQAGVQPGLLVWGRIEGSQVILHPALPVTTRIPALEAGSWTWEARDASGKVLVRVPFEPVDLADAPGDPVRGFSFVVPLGRVPEAALHSLHLFEGPQERSRAIRLAPPAAFQAGAPEPAVRVGLDDTAVTLAWDAARHPLVVVRDAATGEILGFQRGGTGRVATGGRAVEVLACDGVQAERVALNQQ